MQSERPVTQINEQSIDEDTLQKKILEELMQKEKSSGQTKQLKGKEGGFFGFGKESKGSKMLGGLAEKMKLNWLGNQVSKVTSALGSLTLEKKKSDEDQYYKNFQDKF